MDSLQAYRNRVPKQTNMRIRATEAQQVPGMCSSLATWVMEEIEQAQKHQVWRLQGLLRISMATGGSSASQTSSTATSLTLGATILGP